MPPLQLEAAWATAPEFLSCFDAEIAKAGLLVRGASLQNVQAMAECLLTVRVEGRSVEVPARVAAVVPGVGVAVMFEGGVPAPLSALAARLRSGAEEPEAGQEQGEKKEKEKEKEKEKGKEKEGEEASTEAKGPLAERVRAMNATEKMHLALSGGREERFLLLRDPNKMLHVYVLKNPRVGIDEVAWAAKQPTLSPEALKLISENREWNGNATVLIALVRNPKTPLPIALRLMEKIPMSEIRALAKGGAREQIVHAARRKVNG